MPKKIIGKVALTPRGDWNANDTYVFLDVVMDVGNMYIAKQDVPAGTPTSNTAYWFKSISGSGITFDTAMSDTSANGVENRVIKAYVDNEVSNAKSYTDTELNSKVDVEVGKGLSSNDYTNFDKDAVATIVDKADRLMVYDNIGKGSYNLVAYPYFSDSITNNGITFVVNDDGSIVANGTATADAFFNVDARADDLNLTQSGKEYRFTGCPSNGSINTYYVAFTEFGNDKSTITQTFNDVGNGIRFTSKPHFVTGIVLWIKSGQTVTNLTFKPMLVEVDSDGNYPSEYQRNAKSNLELANSQNELAKRTSSIETFLDNIIVRQRFNAPSTVSIPANGYVRVSYDITKNGYTPLGIIGHYFGNANLSVYDLLSSGNTATADVSNRSGSTITLAVDRAFIDVLYIKSNLASAQILEDLVNTSKK